MNYEDFKTELKNYILKAFFEDDLTVTFDFVFKPNERCEIMRIISDNSDYGLTFYPEALFARYSSGSSFHSIAEETAARLYYGLKKDLTFPPFRREDAFKSISLSLINAAKNKELLIKCPYREYLDLAIIPRWIVEGFGSMIIDKAFLKTIGMSEEEVFEIGYKNLENEDFIFDSIIEFCSRLLEVYPCPEIDKIDFEYIPDLYLITTKEMVDGSKAILSDSFMDDVSASTGCQDFFVLPSSRHDLLLLKYSDKTDVSELRRIVREVNATALESVDFLSDEVYRYDCRKHELKICN